MSDGRDSKRRFTVFETNQNKPERILRFLMALVLLPAPFLLGQSAYTLLAAGVGAVLVFNALSGACLTYKAFGVNTCRVPPSEG
jgi:hypothetical protein